MQEYMACSTKERKVWQDSSNYQLSMIASSWVVPLWFLESHQICRIYLSRFARSRFNSSVRRIFSASFRSAFSFLWRFLLSFRSRTEFSGKRAWPWICLQSWWLQVTFLGGVVSQESKDYAKIHSEWMFRMYSTVYVYSIMYQRANCIDHNKSDIILCIMYHWSYIMYHV